MTASRLSSRFEEALVYVARLHSKQVRKGTAIPYVSHLLSVTALVLEAGGDEDESIAALLHDAVDDHVATLEDIRTRFGDRVASIVDGCTDTDALPKPPWRERKEEHIERLRRAPDEVLLVALADKVHNAASTLKNYTREGEAFWDRFRGGMDGTLWYFGIMALLFQERFPGPMADELSRTVASLKQAVSDADFRKRPKDL